MLVNITLFSDFLKRGGGGGGGRGGGGRSIRAGAFIRITTVYNFFLSVGFFDELFLQKHLKKIILTSSCLHF